MACRPSFCTAQASAGSLTSPWRFSTAFWYCRHTNRKMFSANITNRDPAEILLKNTADRGFPLKIKIASNHRPGRF
jgi:hypothetical protein